LSITVKHSFVSAKPEQTDPSLIGPNEWNALHTVTDTSSSYNIYNNLDYNFAAISPGGNLIGGISNTITLPNVPLGVNGADSKHYLYISGGTGAAEAVLITGGTATEGSTNQTLTFTPANSHSGAWTLSSATGGIQEAIIHAPKSSSVGYQAKIYIPQNVTSYATINIPVSAYVIEGAGYFGATITRPGTTSNYHMFELTAGSICEFRNISLSAVSNVPPFALIHSLGNANLRVLNTQLLNGYFGILAEQPASLYVYESSWVNGVNDGQPQGGIKVIGPASNIYIANCVIGGYVTGSNFNATGVWLLDVDGAMLANSGFAGIYSLLLQATTTTGKCMNIWADNLQFDGYGSAAISFQGVTTAFNSIRLSNCHVNGQTLSQGYAIDIGSVAACSPKNVQILGCNIQSASFDGIAVGPGASNLIICNNYITDNNLSNAAHHGISMVGGLTDIHIENNTIGNGRAGSGHQNYGISIAGTFGGTIIGNDLTGNTSGPINITGAINGIIINNLGIDSITGGPISSAASIATPFNLVSTITGVTSVLTITGGWIGRRIRLVKTDTGTLTVGGGGNIPGTHSMTQNTALDLTFDGTNWY